jgi:hypothetical protein
MKGYDTQEATAAIATDKVNFFFGDPSFFACAEVEYDLIPMLTIERQAAGARESW